MVILVVFDAEINERDFCLMKSEMVGLIYPIVAFQFGAVVTEKSFNFCAFRNFFERRFQYRVMISSGGVKFVFVVVRDHIHIDVQHD